MTGLRIPRDLVAGHHDPLRLAEHRDHRCRASKAEIIAALTGNYRPEHLFVVYRALKGDLVYRDLGADGYDAQQRTRSLRQIRRRVASLGFDLVNRETGEILTALP